MLRRIHRRLTANGPGLTLAVIAIVVALTGGAFAAAGKLTSKQKKEVTKIAKKYAGAPGALGAQGPAGPSGQDGVDGINGTNGNDGISPIGNEFAGTKSGHCTVGGVEFKGSNTTFACNGVNGTNGKSAVVTAEPKGTNCAEAGVGIEVEGEPTTKKYACNGSPWTAGGTLPAGATETGAWGFNGVAADAEIVTAISFNIPLKAGLGASKVHYLKVGEQNGTTVPDCPGTSAAPTAAQEVLCVYEGSVGGAKVPPKIEKLSFPETNGTDKSGAALTFIPTGTAFGAGSFAVTGF